MNSNVITKISELSDCSDCKGCALRTLKERYIANSHDIDSPLIQGLINPVDATYSTVSMMSDSEFDAMIESAKEQKAKKLAQKNRKPRKKTWNSKKHGKTVVYHDNQPLPLPDICHVLGIAYPHNSAELYLVSYQDGPDMFNKRMEKLAMIAETFGIYLSIHNSKVARGSVALGYISPVAFGKSNHLTCQYASVECWESCYQNPLSAMYKASRNAHLTNALIFNNLNPSQWESAFEVSYRWVKPDVIRMLDNGDWQYWYEFKFWVDMAKKHPETMFYGYTKAGQAIAEFNQ